MLISLSSSSSLGAFSLVYLLGEPAGPIEQPASTTHPESAATSLPTNNHSTTPPTTPPAEALPLSPSAATTQTPSTQEFSNPLKVALTPQPGGLTADAVAERALPSAPGIEIRRAQLELAAADLDQTMLPFVPQLRGSANYARLSRARVDLAPSGSDQGAVVGVLNPGLVTVGPCPFDPSRECILDAEGLPAGATTFEFDVAQPPLNQFSLQASLSIPVSDIALQLSHARKGSLARIRSTELARDAEIRKTKADAKMAYYNWLRAVAQVVVAEQSLVRTQARLKDSIAAFESGYASKADQMRLEALVANAQGSVAKAREFRSLTEQTLAILMDEEKTGFKIGEDVFAPVPQRDGDSPVGQLVKEAHEQRLELKALDKTIESIAHGIKATRSGIYPRVDIFGDALYANPNQRFFPLENKWNPSWTLGVSLTYVMNQVLLTKALIRQYRGNIQDFSAQKAQLQRAISFEVNQAYTELRSAQSAIQFNAQALEASKEAYRVAVDLYQVGHATTTDIIEAESERVNATLMDVNARIDLRAAQTRLDHALGR